MSEEIVIPTKVKVIQQRTNTIESRKDPNDPNNALIKIENLGYFVQFEGSYESLFVGMEDPGDWLNKGSEVEIIIRPRRNR